jgi:hypothetical protein
MRARANRCHIGALLVALVAPMVARAADEAAWPGALRAGAGAPAASLAGPPAPRLRIPRAAPASDAAPWSSRLTVVELPAEGLSIHARRHHAISIPFDGARRAFRDLGIDATECALQLRMPARLRRDPVAGARAGLEMQAQVRLACRM